MIKYEIGDLLEGDCDIIAHQANCFKTMGGGIARVIKAVYPEAYEADLNFNFSPESRLGMASHAVTKGTNGLEKTIFNLYGQYQLGTDKRQTNYDALSSALESMMETINVISSPDSKIGVPYKMGCDLAGGDWNVVSEILDRVSGKFGKTIHVIVLPHLAKEVEHLLEVSE
ncbi:Appr-1-p processing protein [Lysinibacillus phage vB_LfM_LysYB1]|nr:Appr-1-p processing protein [Lysinibacillus phage vB_LfM_LysYB1]WAB25231.1 Appr-1-p processing protein [Lysinibacillus phage vB_LfM_LysYB2]